jgi:hypothetical protein
MTSTRTKSGRWPLSGLAVQASGLLLLLLGGAAHAQGSPWRFGQNLGMGFDTNIGNAENKQDVQGSTFVSLDSQLDYSRRVFETFAFTARAVLQGQDYFRFNKLSSAKGTGMLRLTYRPGSDFYTPELTAWGSAAYWRFESYIRTSDDYRYGLIATENLTTQVDLRLGLTGSRRISNTRVFTLHGDSASLSTDWQVSDAFTVYGGFQYYYGGVVSSGTPDANIIRAAEVIEPDDVFGGATTDQFAYRLRAHSRIGNFGLNYVVSPICTIDAQTQYIDTVADFDNRYTRWLNIVSLLLRF